MALPQAPTGIASAAILCLILMLASALIAVGVVMLMQPFALTLLT